ncbi:MAG: hypothetical protein ACQEV6_10795 [Pseudomonadota bacterium]
MNWVVENKEWLFSGAAIAIPIAVLGWFITLRRNKQVQKGGDNSTNIQVGRDLSVGGRKEDE